MTKRRRNINFPPDVRVENLCGQSGARARETEFHAGRQTCPFDVPLRPTVYTLPTKLLASPSLPPPSLPHDTPFLRAPLARHRPPTTL